MKVLILSCNTGEGHNSCAKALKIEMDRQGIECEVADTLALVNETLSRRVSEAYVFSTKGPVFEHAYKLGGMVSDLQGSLIKSPVYNTNKLYAKRLYDYIVEGKFDAVVCVHLFPAEALTSLHRKAKLMVPTFFVMTDYTCIPFLAETELDHYIIPHEHLIEEFVEKGLKREKLVPIGIPIDEAKFTQSITREQARQRVAEEFGWRLDEVEGNWYLIMSGSMGFGNLGDLVNELLLQCETNDRILCVCGNNEKMRYSLQDSFGGEKPLKIIGFTDKVALLMDASDVIFTKPGGITSTEAAVKHIPLIHTAPIPGLENFNARFFHYHNMSYHTNDVQQQVIVAKRLCNDEAYRLKMIDAQCKNTNPKTSQLVVELVRNVSNAQVKKN